MSFEEVLRKYHLDIRPSSIETLQVNLTKTCNQACRHCHVDSSPNRRESMDRNLVNEILKILEDPRFKILDLTGGAPELHPQFREIVTRATELKKNVIVRHNLTVCFDPHPVTKESMYWIHDFFMKKKVEVISSLPYYREYLTDRQRGVGVFKKSIMGLQELNKRGYGKKGTDLLLNLVFNPVGAYLPPLQKSLEDEYKIELKTKFDIEFNNLYTITNMPIKRFKEDLERNGQYELYMEKLRSSFNPIAAKSVMCRNTVSVSWDGKIYDCDFNQMLNLQCNYKQNPLSLENFDYDIFSKRDIIWGNHCFGCTAGAGSSCGGTLT